jgi:EKC/KEOPS complex subunit CGI121/TPRKB
VTEATKHLLVIKVSTSPEITHDSVAQHLDGAIEGTPIPFSDESLRAVLDLDGLLGAYKLGAVIANRKLDGISEEDRQRLEKCIIGSIGLRGAT